MNKTKLIALLILVSSTASAYVIKETKVGEEFAIWVNRTTGGMGKVISASGANGTLTLGASNYLANSYHTFQGGSGIAFNNQGGAVGIGSNLNFDGTRNFNRTDTTKNGGAVVLDANSVSTNGAISFIVQPPGGSVGGTTGTEIVGTVTGAGGWVLGKSGGTVTHDIHGPVSYNFPGQNRLVRGEGASLAHNALLSITGLPDQYWGQMQLRCRVSDTVATVASYVVTRLGGTFVADALLSRNGTGGPSTHTVAGSSGLITIQNTSGSTASCAYHLEITAH